MAENKAPEVTVESLQALVDELNAKEGAQPLKLIQLGDHFVIAPADLDESTIDLADFEARLEREIRDHQATKGNLANALAELTEAATFIDGQKATIDEQEATILKLQTSPAAFPTITVDKVTYEVQAKSFQYKKEEYTLAQLLKDKSLQKELVKKGVGFLVKTEV